MFVDGTALNLGANTRMVMSEFVFNPNSTNNSNLLSLVTGSFAFVSGEVAKTGGLNFETPVATMGIRGTTGGAACASSCEFTATPDAKDGHASTYTLQYNGSIIGTVTVNNNTIVGPSGPGQPPVVSFAPAGNNADLSALGQQLVSTYSQMFVPTPPLPIPQSNSPNGSTTPQNLLLQNDHPQPPLVVVPPLTETVAVIPPTPATPPATLTVVFTQPPPNNLPPKFDNPIANKISVSDPVHTFTFTVPANTFSDPDTPQDALIVTATLADGSPLPNWLSFDPATRTFSGTPPDGAAGVIPLQLVVSDGVSTVVDKFTITIFSAITQTAGATGPLNVDLLAAAHDRGGGGTLSAVNADSSIVTAGGRTLVLGTDYTVSAAGAFELTAEGLAHFKNLSASQHDSFTFHYTISDGTVALGNTLTVTVDGTNDAPTFNAIALTVGEAGPLNVDLLAAAHAADPDTGDTLSAVNGDTTIVTAGHRTLHSGTDYTVTNGVFALTAEGLAQFKSLSASQHDSFTLNYQISDGTAALANTLAVTVEGANDAPTFSAITQAVAEDGPALSVDLLAAANATDPDTGDTLSATNADTTIVTAGHRTLHAGADYTVINGVFALTAAGFAQFNSLGAAEHDSFALNYQIADGTAAVGNTLTVTVDGTNDAPVIVGVTATGAVPSSALTGTAASDLTADHNLINGLGGPHGFGENTLAANDDGSTGAINIDSVFGSTGLNFFGHTFHSLFVNNNGNVTFAAPTSQFTPSQITAGLNNPIIAPFWADVDTRGGAATPTPGGNSTGSNLVYYDLDTVNHVLTVTWDDVGFFSAHTAPLNAFQLQLIGLGNGDFDIVFRYEDLNWTTGDVSGGAAARAGYSAGDGVTSHSFELPQSGNADQILALESTTGNTNIAGVDVFQVQSGNVTTAPVSNGAIQFADPDATDTHTAIQQAAGTGYLGTFSLDPVDEASRSVAWHFTLDSDEINFFFNPSATQPRQQFYNVTINDGHPGSSATEQVGLSVGSTSSDTFAFAPGAGQELVFNFATSGAADKIDLRNFTTVNAGNIVLQAINNSHDTLVDLGRGDSVTLIGVQAAQLADLSNHFMLHA
jgi:VCBS repeat-containing protein